jgi:hypothetical protein
MKNARTSSPVFFVEAPGTPVPLNSPKREWSAGRRWARASALVTDLVIDPPHAVRRHAHALRSACPPHGAPRRRFRASGPYDLGRMSLPARDPRRLSPRLVRLYLPRMAAGPSAGGRLPEASRARGYEARAQAPHPIPPARRLMRTPSNGSDARMIRPRQDAGISFRRNVIACGSSRRNRMPSRRIQRRPK